MTIETIKISRSHDDVTICDGRFFCVEFDVVVEISDTTEEIVGVEVTDFWDDCTDFRGLSKEERQQVIDCLEAAIDGQHYDAEGVLMAAREAFYGVASY